MSDIIIYTTRETLEHKKGGDDYLEYCWEFSRLPKRINMGDRVYFACEGLIQGYFIIDSIEDDDLINWYADTWKELKKKIPAKPFQGFKYADKVKELVNKK